jgi:hypothetical protein
VYTGGRETLTFKGRTNRDHAYFALHGLRQDARVTAGCFLRVKSRALMNILVCMKQIGARPVSRPNK